MSEALQAYEKIVRLKPGFLKGGDKLSRPLAAQQAAPSTRDGLPRVESATLRGIRNVERDLAQGGWQFAPSLMTLGNQSEHALEMVAVGERS